MRIDKSSDTNEEMTMTMRIRRPFVAVALALAIPALCAQEAPTPQPAATAAKMPEAKASETTQPKEESSTTDHIIHLGAQTISYKANASTTLLKNDKNESVASIFSV